MTKVMGTFRDNAYDRECTLYVDGTYRFDTYGPDRISYFKIENDDVFFKHHKDEGWTKIGDFDDIASDELFAKCVKVIYKAYVDLEAERILLKDPDE